LGGVGKARSDAKAAGISCCVIPHSPPADSPRHQSRIKAKAEGSSAAAASAAIADDPGGDIFRTAAALERAEAAAAARRSRSAALQAGGSGRAEAALDPGLDLAASEAERYAGFGTAHAGTRVGGRGRTGGGGGAVRAGARGRHVPGAVRPLGRRRPPQEPELDAERAAVVPGAATGGEPGDDLASSYNRHGEVVLQASAGGRAGAGGRDVLVAPA
jgi:hypothetical protein